MVKEKKFGSKKVSLKKEKKVLATKRNMEQLFLGSQAKNFLLILK